MCRVCALRVNHRVARGRITLNEIIAIISANMEKCLATLVESITTNLLRPFINLDFRSLVSNSKQRAEKGRNSWRVNAIIRHEHNLCSASSSRSRNAWGILPINLLTSSEIRYIFLLLLFGVLLLSSEREREWTRATQAWQRELRKKRKNSSIRAFNFKVFGDKFQ